MKDCLLKLTTDSFSKAVYLDVLTFNLSTAIVVEVRGNKFATEVFFYAGFILAYNENTNLMRDLNVLTFFKTEA
jgi:hypothetical protein